MLAACSSNFLPFEPDVYLACISTASAYRAAVDLDLDSLDPTAFADLQRNALYVSEKLQASVEADSCGTSPALTMLYSSDLIAHINSTFQQYAGRVPTIYEFLDAINIPELGAANTLFVDDRATWESYLISKAQSAANIHPPAANISMSKTSNRLKTTITFYANPPTAGALYLWKLSTIGGGSGSAISATFSPLFNTTYQFSGFVKVTNESGVKNMGLLNTNVTVFGSCAPSPKYHCN